MWIVVGSVAWLVFLIWFFIFVMPEDSADPGRTIWDDWKNP
jgi:hypothetical protein